MTLMLNPIIFEHDRYASSKLTLNKEQVNGAVMIVEHWNHSQRCRLIERLLPSCSAAQIDMLWTVLQPSLHRDYFYAVKSRYPNYHFKRISTPESRLQREFYHRYIDREESFYLSNINDLHEFRDDDGASRKSQSSFGRYTENKSLPTTYYPPIRRSALAKHNERNQCPSRSLDTNLYIGKQQKYASEYASRTARSITIRMTEHSIGSSTTAPAKIDSEQLYHWFINNWSESEQNDFLRRLIVKFDERQQYFISCAITQRRYRDMISLLPRPIVFQILGCLTFEELSRCRQVCKTWKSAIDRERDLWRPKTKSTKSEPASKIVQVDWEKIRKQTLATKRNWATGTAHMIKCAGHTERVLSICGNATHLATGSLDRTVNVWLLKTGKLCQTLVGHSKGVWSLRFLSKILLVSGGYDATIKIWNINTGICLRTLLSHSGPVWSLACSSSLCLSGSQDRTARIWRLPKCELCATLTGHTSSVFGVDLNPEQNLCATASADKTVRIWSLSTAQCIKILYSTTDDYIMSVSLRYGYIAFSFGVHIMVYRITLSESRPCSVQKIMETQEHRGRVESVQLILLSDEDKQPGLVSAGHDGLVKFWDFDNISSQHTFNTQSDEIVKINCIYVDRTHIVTVGDDCLVRILNFESSKK